MKLKHPVVITPRLLPGVRVGGDHISIDYSKRPGRGGRVRYHWYIDIGSREYTDDDLQSGVGGGSLQEGLESLLSFLGAAAESYGFHKRTGKKGENADLFKPAVAEWAYQHDDEISMLQSELSERRGLIHE